MKLSPSHLKRYREILGLLWKYGRSDLVKQLNAAEGFDAQDIEPKTDGKATPESLADDLEAMGPTYVKLGQVLAGRPDLLPEAYIKALARLQDRVKPFSYEEVEQIVLSELGTRISKAFSTFDMTPMAAASLGQVHVATLRDGKVVAVKVQRPNIRKQIAEDFEVLGEIAEFLDKHTDTGRRYRFRSVLDEFRATILQELDYLREAQNMVAIGKHLEEFKLVRIPQPVMDFCTRSVLTMDFVKGTKITALGPLSSLDLETAPLIEQLFRAYLKQVLIDGLFHADPHPGNVFVTDDKRIALLDLGMVGHIAPGMQESLLKLLLAVSEGSGEEAADLVVRISEKMEDFDLAEFRRQISRLVSQHRDQGLSDLNVGGSLLTVSRQARQNGLLVPSELTLLGKTLLQLDEVGEILNPQFDPNACIRRNVSQLMSQRMRKDLSQGNAFSTLLEMKDFASNFPSRMNRIMDAIANAELEVRVKATDTKTIVDGMQKIANRIAAGVVLAALIIGASLMMRIQTHFQLFGYPGIAMLCFLLAGGGGFWLLVSIFFQDEKIHKKNR
ncbi:MAG TPA: AarF/UbiB family protein [Opitutaceae bacterium]